MGNSKRPTKIIYLVPTNHVWFSWCFFSFSNKYWKWRWIWNFGKLQQGNSKLFVFIPANQVCFSWCFKSFDCKVQTESFQEMKLFHIHGMQYNISVKSQQDTKLINFIVENIATSKKISTLKWSREKWENQLSNVL